MRAVRAIDPFQYGGYSFRRFAATLIDYLSAQLIVHLALFPFFDGKSFPSDLITPPEDMYYEYLAISTALNLVLTLTHTSLSEWRFGATIGKAICSLRVRSIDSDELNLSTAVRRNAWKLLQWSTPLLFLLFFGGAGNSVNLADRRAGTEVTRI